VHAVARIEVGGWGTLKSRFPEDLAPLADELASLAGGVSEAAVLLLLEARK
jgi:hypothetical protein